MVSVYYVRVSGLPVDSGFSFVLVEMSHPLLTICDLQNITFFYRLTGHLRVGWVKSRYLATTSTLKPAVSAKQNLISFYYD
jgi:hypothetical protein